MGNRQDLNRLLEVANLELAYETVQVVWGVSLRVSRGQVVSINLPAVPANQEPAGVKVVRQCTRPWVDTYDRRHDTRQQDRPRQPAPPM